MKTILRPIVIFIILSALIYSLFGIDEFEKWKNQQADSFKSYRSKQDEQFVNFLKENWQKFELSKIQIKDEKPKPEMIPIAESSKLINVKDNTIMIGEIKVPEIIIPEKIEKEQPREDIKIDAVEEEHFMEVYNPEEKKKVEAAESIRFDFWGLPLCFALDEIPTIKLKETVDKKVIAEFWYNTGEYNFGPVVEQLLAHKTKLKLNDWDYCKLINAFSAQMADDDITLNRLFNWFFLVKSGFDVKIGYNKETVNLLIPTNRKVFGRTYLTIEDRKYYLISFDSDAKMTGGIYTYDKKYPDSNDLLNLDINSLPNIPENSISKDYKFKYKKEEFEITLDFDKTSAQLFEDYPQTELTVYFKAPISDNLEYALASQFKPILEGRNQVEAVTILLRFVQTAFQYQTDNAQFGREKALTTIETLYYPYSDCEDRSVIFSYLVRSLLNLEVIALDYPGHIATAVKLDGNIEGDIIVYSGKKYLVCDPTYINAEIGMTMPKFRKINPEIFTF